MLYQNILDDERLERAIMNLCESGEVSILEQTRNGVTKPVMLAAGEHLTADYFEKGSSPEALRLVNNNVVDQCVNELIELGLVEVCGYTEDGEREVRPVAQTRH